MGTENTNTLKFKKGSATSWQKDLFSDFNMVVLENPPSIPIEFKEVVSTDFSDEEGEGVYFPDKLRCKGVDWKVKVGSLGISSVILGRLQTFIDYLRGGDNTGTEVTIGNPWTNQQYGKCYLKSISDIEYFKQGTEAYATMSITFRITDPSIITVFS